MGRVDIADYAEHIREAQQYSESLLWALGCPQPELRRLMVKAITDQVTACMGAVLWRLDEAENDPEIS